MKSMRIALEYGERDAPPILEGFFESPELDREVILGGQVVDGVETITSFVYGTPDAYEPLVDDCDDVLEYDVTPSSDGFFVYLRRKLGAQGASLLESLSQRTVVVVPPIEVRSDRTIRMTLVGHPDDLRLVLEETPDGVSLDVRSIRDGTVSAPTRLSSRQSQALTVAWDVGYYEVPRRNGIETVAAELDCAVSTASELLRRAESRLVGQTLDVESQLV
ncbi:helix-turn-helix domain-containing protein [Natrarchaeobius oligotrophus]|uniref:Bacterio-opsin activator n=1 Tax=Natrarchaeobius chitinivorans TaxID=1679083 RepID=A0A3N6N1B2_NATCH|nr:helix-turn-helix domain-containing protein [Natrarchaeobius chitinivorans]RQH01317.1 bacterio-opsin activator [Natrarchaeobius chitinivorans]